MNGWEITIICLFGMELGAYAAKDGKRKTGKYSFGWKLFNVLVTAFILYKAGLFQ